MYTYLWLQSTIRRTYQEKCNHSLSVADHISPWLILVLSWDCTAWGGVLCYTEHGLHCIHYSANWAPRLLLRVMWEFKGSHIIPAGSFVMQLRPFCDVWNRLEDVTWNHSSVTSSTPTSKAYAYDLASKHCISVHTLYQNELLITISPSGTMVYWLCAFPC